MQYKENWFPIGLLLVVISMSMESWGKYVVGTFAALFILASFGSSVNKEKNDYKRYYKP
jgi:hypothetical protein